LHDLFYILEGVKMAIELSPRSFVDLEYYKLASGETFEDDSDEAQNVIVMLNSTIKLMENICKKPLKERLITFDPLEEDYELDEDLSIFDGITGDTFWFPLDPINSINRLIISGNAIPKCESYLDTEGYYLYPKLGKLKCYRGFDHGYLGNIYIEYSAGYKSGSEEFNDLQKIQMDMVSNFNENGSDSNYISETIGNYRYQKATPKDLSNDFGIPLSVFNRLNYYRRVVFA